MAVLKRTTIGIATNDALMMKTPYYRDDRKIRSRRAIAVPILARTECYRASSRCMLHATNICMPVETKLTGESLLQTVEKKIYIKNTSGHKNS